MSLASRQPTRQAWPREKLLRERAIALGQAIDKTTLKSYSSALNSYLSFVRLHELPVEPTPDTLSFFTVFMSHHINPRSVTSYLSGICQQLEPYFTGVREARRSPLVERTLKGCTRLKGTAVKRKRALTTGDLNKVVENLQHSNNHDDKLFIAILLTGFFALMRLGELTFPNDKSLHNWRKISKRYSTILTNDHYEFQLPSHKADRFFEGNHILIKKDQFSNLNPLAHFKNYLNIRDSLYPLSSPLWLTEKCTVPTRQFFMTQLHRFFDDDVGGHSMRGDAGGFSCWQTREPRRRRRVGMFRSCRIICSRLNSVSNSRS